MPFLRLFLVGIKSSGYPRHYLDSSMAKSLRPRRRTDGPIPGPLRSCGRKWLSVHYCLAASTAIPPGPRCDPTAIQMRTLILWLVYLAVLQSIIQVESRMRLGVFGICTLVVAIFSFARDLLSMQSLLVWFNVSLSESRIILQKRKPKLLRAFCSDSLVQTITNEQ